MKKVLYFFCLLFLCYSSKGQFVGLVVNEFSQGSGLQEYIEIVVVGNRTCLDSTADIRGWIFDDENGWYSSGSHTSGHFRFANNANWSKVPFGSIILLYNSGDKNPAITDVDDPNDANNNLLYVVPDNSIYLDRHNNSPLSGSSSPAYSYASAPAGNYFSGGGAWGSTTSFNTAGDVISLVRPSVPTTAFFSLAFGYGSTPNPGFQTPTVMIGSVGSARNTFLKDRFYSNVSSWEIPPTAIQTPGYSNGADNTDWINEMRAPAARPTISINPSISTICPNQTVDLTATAGFSSYAWAPSTGLSFNFGQVVTASPSLTTAYTVTGTDANGCTATATATVNAPPSPPAPTLSVTNHCGSSVLTATGFTGTLVWSDGATSSSPRTVTSGGTYTVRQTVGSCTSNASNQVTAAPLTPPPTLILSVANNCGNSVLAVTNTSDIYGTFTWSDGSNVSNPRTVTVAGNYTVRQTVGICTSAASNSVTAAPNPVPAAPTLTVTNNCGNSTITASGFAGTLIWSDGGSGNPRTVTTGGTYTVRQTIGSCTSVASNSVIAAPNPLPAAPTLAVTNHCGNSTITASGFTGTLIWSDGGSGNPRTVPAGNYTVRQTIGSCTSVASNSVTAAPNPLPAAPTLAVTNNCGNSTITASGFTGTLTWSDGGAGNPRTVTTGNYTVTQTIGSCTSVASNSVTATPNPMPAAPTLAVTNNCGNSTITASGFTGTLTWSDGGSGNPRTVTTGSYTVRQTIGSCTSVPSNAVTGAPNPVPAAPTLAVTNNCGNSTITASGFTGTLTWSDGGSGNPRTVTTGSYTVRQTIGSCTSVPSNAVTATPNPIPAAPTLAVTNNCGNSTITASGFTGTLTWSDGGSGNPRTVTTGSYTVMQTIGSCTSVASNSVTATPNPIPAAPTLAVTNNCGNSTITASGFTGTLTWSDGGTGNPRTVTTGNYTVTQTIGSCTSVASNSVTATPNPIPAAPTLAVTNNCGNSTITASGFTGTLTWSDGGSGNPRTVTTGSYTIRQTIGSCTSVASNSVTAAPNPIPAAPTLAITNNCGNSTITASEFTGTLIWSDGGSGNPRTVTSGSYTVTQTMGSCTSVASNSVTAAPNPAPAAPTLAVTNNCGNSTITANGFTGTLTWSDGGSGNPRTVTTGSYTVTQTNVSCTSVASNSVTAAPNPLPAAPTLAVTNNCGNSTITASGIAGTLIWSDGGSGNPRTVTTGSYTVRQTIGSCTSVASNSVNAAPNPTAIASVSINTPATVCSGSLITFNATPTNGGTIPTYQWLVNGIAVNGQTNSTFTSSTLVSGNQVSVRMTSTATCAVPATVTSNVVTVNNTAAVVPAVSIIPTSVTSCSGSPVMFTAAADNGGTTPTYQWKVNGNNVAGTGNTFTSSTLNNNDVVSVVMTSNASCATTPNATSNAVTVTITSAAAPAVSITPTSVTSCNGSPVTFTASPVNGGTAPTYQWRINGNNISASGNTFTSSTLNNNDVVSVVMTSNASCATTPNATSNAVTVTITSAAAPAVSITPTSVTSCNASPVTFTASPVNGGTAPTYQWRINGNNVSASGNTFTSSTLNNNDVVSVVMTSNASCATTPNATSNAVTVTITSAAAPAVSITPTSVTSCIGSPVTFTASPVNGGTAPTYQWKVNGNNVAGTGNTFTSSTLNNNDVVSVVMTSNAPCATTPTATSNAVTVTITSAAAPAVSITPTSVASCSGLPVTFTAAPVNGGTAPIYQWKVNSNNVTGTGNTFTSSTLDNNDIVSVVMTSNASCATTPNATSNTVAVTITSAAAPAVSITPTSVTSCSGSAVTFTAAPVNGGTAPTYQWKVNGNNVAGTGNIFTSSTLNNNDIVSVMMTSNASCATTPNATSNAVTVTISSAGAPTLSVIDPTCSTPGGSITITSSTTGLEFSLDGAAYMSYPAGGFTNIASGLHLLSVRNSAGCSTTINVSVAPAPGAPSAPVYDVTQPTCTTPTGTITITSSTIGLEFSLDGAAYAIYPAGGFTNIASGSHSLSVRNSAGCSTTINVSVAPAPGAPSVPVYNVTQPTCTTPTGTITITSSTTGLEFSLGGAAYMSYPAGGFTNIASGSHSLSVRNSAGCSTTINVSVAAAPGAPNAPTYNVTQPTCTTTTGTITITSSTVGLQFSLDGGAYANYPTGGFTNVASGSHSLSVRNSAGCSTTINVSVASAPSSLLAPLFNVSNPTCSIPTGTITVISPVGLGMTYSIDGVLYNNVTGIFQGLGPANYNVTARLNGCVSPVSIATITPNNAIVTATAFAPSIICGQSSGTVTLNASNGTLPYRYSNDNGASYQQSNVFTGLPSGQHSFRVLDANGCSANLTATIKQQVSNITNQSSTIFGCNSVLFKGITYTSSSVVWDTIRTSANCDSIYQSTNIIVNNTPAIVQSSTINGCDSVVFNSKIFKSSTVLKDTVKTTTGCDSVYVTININVSSFNLTLAASKNPAFEGTAVNLSVSAATPFQTTTWLPAHLFPSQTTFLQRIVADSSRMITVTAESNMGCIDTAQLFLEVKPYTDFFIPNAFSPNNDGKNDLFAVMGTTIDKGRIRIFNQWGGLVFSTDDVTRGWDGMSRGKQQPGGVYVYEVHVTMRNGSEIKKKGFVNLIR